MAFFISNTCDFTIRCKGCNENINAPVGTMPSSWIIAACPLCQEKRRYLPTEIFRGRLSQKLIEKMQAAGGAMIIKNGTDN
ncbi:hypothetical protein [Terracidiphilus gabretensis]|uniref:hypothetical protein n=1 Tax=Terracidiphilus gabretensis TaxID=1577687 RepID=UPI00071B4F36|nr:hypothetical protein [Terracidiphilus gabretensis]